VPKIGGSKTGQDAGHATRDIGTIWSSESQGPQASRSSESRTSLDKQLGLIINEGYNAITSKLVTTVQVHHTDPAVSSLS
jgi:hypothetical protein